jgi:hypothetical protein
VVVVDGCLCRFRGIALYTAFSVAFCLRIRELVVFITQCLLSFNCGSMNMCFCCCSLALRMVAHLVIAVRSPRWVHKPLVLVLLTTFYLCTGKTSSGTAMLTTGGLSTHPKLPPTSIVTEFNDSIKRTLASPTKMLPFDQFHSMFDEYTK